jgi:hypothetical protein
MQSFGFLVLVVFFVMCSPALHSNSLLMSISTCVTTHIETQTFPGTAWRRPATWLFEHVTSFCLRSVTGQSQHDSVTIKKWHNKQPSWRSTYDHTSYDRQQIIKHDIFMIKSFLNPGPWTDQSHIKQIVVSSTPEVYPSNNNCAMLSFGLKVHTHTHIYIYIYIYICADHSYNATNYKTWQVYDKYFLTLVQKMVRFRQGRKHDHFRSIIL